ncbi:hypothetical protein D3C73_1154290 [compost metagenome]
MVWCWNRSLGLSTMPAWRARLTTCIETMESPPSSKKLSSRPTLSMASTSCQIAARDFSSSLRGATCSRCCWLPSTAGKALRSSLPLGVSGSCPRNNRNAGTM